MLIAYCHICGKRLLSVFAITNMFGKYCSKHCEEIDLKEALRVIDSSPVEKIDSPIVEKVESRFEIMDL